MGQAPEPDWKEPRPLRHCELGCSGTQTVPPGLERFFAPFPALKRWAKIARPSGPSLLRRHRMKRLRMQCDPANPKLSFVDHPQRPRGKRNAVSCGGSSHGWNSSAFVLLSSSMASCHAEQDPCSDRDHAPALSPTKDESSRTRVVAGRYRPSTLPQVMLFAASVPGLGPPRGEASKPPIRATGNWGNVPSFRIAGKWHGRASSITPTRRVALAIGPNRSSWTQRVFAPHPA